MTDHRLRALERSFRETGTVEAEAAWLRARVQTGELERVRLELAAHLEYPAATVAVTPEATGDTLSLDSPLLPRGTVARIRSAAAHSLVSLVSPDSTVSAALDGLVLRPVLRPRRTMAVRQAVAEVGMLLGTLSHHDPSYDQQRHVGVALALLFGGDDWREGELAEIRRLLAAAGVDVDPALREELVPWLLGYSDPVRERVEARQRQAESSHGDMPCNSIDHESPPRRSPGRGGSQ